MKIIPIISAVIIVIGCFMPWIQLGALFANRGIDNPDGAIMMAAGVIAGGIAIYNNSQTTPKNTWIYLVVGVVGLIIAYLDLNEVSSRAEKIAQGLGEVSTFFGGDKNVSMMNFVGSGLYIVSIGSVGLLLCGLGVFKSDTQQNDKVYQEKINDVTAPKYVKKVVIEKTKEEIENKKYREELKQLHKAVLSQQNKIFGSGMTHNISALLDDLCKTQEDAIYLLNTYNELFKTDLIDDLKKLNSSYDIIKRNVSKFIEFELIDENYPHAPKS